MKPAGQINDATSPPADVNRMKGWIRVPIGEGAQPYISIPFVRTVLVVARTVTTTVWLLDFLAEVFGDDPRVQVLFTVEDESPSVYHRGALDLLHDVGATVLPWAQACATRFDVAICSTHTGSLEHLRSPLFITPHGPGFGKPASVRPGGEVPLPIDAGWERSSLPRTTVVLSHPEQASLFAGHPPAKVRLLVAGDPAYDRLRASAWQRDRYRRAFEVGVGQRLAVLSSTWGPGAQLGAIPDLAVRLRGELAVDEYRVAMIIHPNIWFGHGPWQVRTWLRTAQEAGVLLVPPRGDEWRAAILAADVVIADHGSVGFYAAAVGRPVLRASFGDEYLRPDAPLAQLGRLVPSLDLREPFGPQLVRVISEHDPQRCADVVARMFAADGASVRIMRDALYGLIGLDVPASPARVLAVGQPQLQLPVITAHIVYGDVAMSRAGSRCTVTLRRGPAALDDRRPTSWLGGGGGRHLVVDEAEPHALLFESAAIVTRDTQPAYGVAAPPTHKQWAAHVLDELPGCRFAASVDPSAGSAAVGARDGRRLDVQWHVPDGDSSTVPDAAILPSVAYLLDVVGRLEDVTDLSVTVRLGDASHVAQLSDAS